jgi:glutaredoxin
MKKNVKFYHAGCPVCVSAEDIILDTIDPGRFELEIIHLGDNPERIDEAESAGIESVPALLVGSEVFHINFGASISDLKA